MRTLNQYINEFLVKGHTQKQNDEIEFVDLDLPSHTLWATRNLGAESPEDPGYYYMFGSTDNLSHGERASLDNTVFVEPGQSRFSQSYFYKNFKTWFSDKRLKEKYDAAYTENASWRIPTEKDFKELIENTYGDIYHDEDSEMIMLVLKSKRHDDRNIKIPFGGYKVGNSFEEQFSSANLWTSEIYRELAANMFTAETTRYEVITIDISCGLNIRPVKNS